MGRYHTLTHSVVRCARAVCIAAFALLCMHCGESPASRYAKHVEAAAMRFGPDQRLRAAIAPGRAVSTDDERAPVLVSLRASAPWPVVTLENGTLEPQALEVSIDNLAADAQVSATQTALSDDARRDLRCTQPPFSDGATVRLSAPAQETPFRVTLNPCASLRLEWQAASEQVAEQRWVVIPRAGGDAAALGDAVAAAEAAGADVIVLLGGLSQRGGGFVTPESDTPVVAVLARRDVRIDADAFLRRFGQVDWTVSRDGVRWLVLDTADGLLSDGQLRFVEQTPTDARTGVAFVDRIPFGNTGVSAFRSAQQGLHIARLLDRLGVEHLIGNADAGPLRQQWSSTAIHGVRPLSAERTLLEVVRRVDADGVPEIEVSALAY